MNNAAAIAHAFDTLAQQGSAARTLTLAHQAAEALAACQTPQQLQHFLQTAEIEPLDCLQALIGSYLEDRIRHETIDDEPF